MKILLPLLLLLLPLIGNAESEPVKTTGEAYLDNFFENTQNMQADFSQTLRTHDGEVLQQTSGRFYLKRPGLFRWDYEKPEPQLIVSDGQRIWMYDVELQQVTVQKQAAAVNGTPMALLQDRNSLHKSFRVIPLDHRDDIYRLKLESRSKDADFGEIVVGVDKEGLRFLQLHDQFEQVTDIVFSNARRNTDMRDDLFRFVPPEGVDVFGG